MLRPSRFVYSRGRSRAPYVEDLGRNVIGLPSLVGAPPSLVRQVRAYVARRDWFTPEDAAGARKSARADQQVPVPGSEDALTWSWFGTLSIASPQARRDAVEWLLKRLELDAALSSDVTIRQWVRVRTLGPEVDAVVEDPRGLLLYAEAKWDAQLGTGRGVTEGSRDDQINLRRLALQAEQRRRPRVVLGISRALPDLARYNHQETGDRPVWIRWITWGDLAECSIHPHAAEFSRYLAWKTRVVG